MFKELASEEGQLSKNKTLLHTQMRNSSFKANSKKKKEKKCIFLEAILTAVLQQSPKMQLSSSPCLISIFVKG